MRRGQACLWVCGGVGGGWEGGIMVGQSRVGSGWVGHGLDVRMRASAVASDMPQRVGFPNLKNPMHINYLHDSRK